MMQMMRMQQMQMMNTPPAVSYICAVLREWILMQSRCPRVRVPLAMHDECRKHAKDDDERPPPPGTMNSLDFTASIYYISFS